MKKIFWIGVFCFLFFEFQAQKKENEFVRLNDGVAYDILRNSPENSKNFSFMLIPLSVEKYKPNSDYSLSYELGLNLRTKRDRFYFETHFKNAYYDRLHEKPIISPFVQIGYPVHGTDACLSGNATLTINFFKKKLVRRNFVPVLNVGMTSSFTIIKADVIKQIGLRFGTDYYKGEFKFDNGIEGNIIDRNSSSPIPFKSGSNSFFTMVSTQSFNIGISRAIIRDLKTILDYSGIKLNRGVYSVSTYYFDVLFAPNIHIDNINVAMNYDYSYGWYNYQLIDLSNTKTQPYGFRLGWQRHETQRFGQTWGLETGIRPGIAGNNNLTNLYFSLKYGVSLSALLLKQKVES